MPIDEPTTDSWRQNMRARSADGSGPVVAPATTTVPPGRKDLSEWSHVALPDGFHHCVDPLGQPTARLDGRDGAELQRPGPLFLAPARDVDGEARSWPSRIAAVATPPPAPWTSTDWPGRNAARVNNIRYAVRYAVGRQAASANENDSGFGTRLRDGTAIRGAIVPGTPRSEKT